MREKQSETSIQGKPRISKKGNRHLRKSQHLPSLSAVKWDTNFKEVYARLVSKHGIKMKALVAIQRKILELMYVLYKNETVYEKDFCKKIACSHKWHKHAMEAGSKTALEQQK